MRDRDLLLATPRARRRADSRLPVTSRVTNPLLFQGGLLELQRSAHLPGRASLIAWCSFAPPSPGFSPLLGIGPVTGDQHASVPCLKYDDSDLSAWPGSSPMEPRAGGCR